MLKVEMAQPHSEFIKPREPRASTPKKCVEPDSFITDISFISPYLNAANKSCHRSELCLANIPKSTNNCAAVTLRSKATTRLRRSQSLLNLQTSDNEGPRLKQLLNNNSNKLHQNSNKDSCCIDAKLLQCLAEKHLRSKRKNLKVEEMKSKLSATQEAISARMKTLSRTKRRLKEVECWKKEEEDLNELENTSDEILQTFKKINKNELNSLIGHLRGTLNRLSVKNVPLPEEKKDVIKMQKSIVEILAVLNDYELLKTQKNCNVEKLARLIKDHAELCRKVKLNLERCEDLLSELNRCVVHEKATQIMVKNEFGLPKVT